MQNGNIKVSIDVYFWKRDTVLKVAKSRTMDWRIGTLVLGPQSGARHISTREESPTVPFRFWWRQIFFVGVDTGRSFVFQLYPQSTKTNLGSPVICEKGVDLQRYWKTPFQTLHQNKCVTQTHSKNRESIDFITLLVTDHHR